MNKVTNKQVETLFDNIVSDVVTRVNEHRVHRPGMKLGKNTATVNVTYKKKEPKVPKTKEHLDNEDKIKIGLWFIKKMGGIVDATRVFKAAEKALEAMGD